jgi:hypothetical protein
MIRFGIGCMQDTQTCVPQRRERPFRHGRIRALHAVAKRRLWEIASAALTPVWYLLRGKL